MSFWGKKGKVLGIVGMSVAGALLISGSATMFTGTLMTNDKSLAINAAPPGPPGPGAPSGPPPSGPPGGIPSVPTGTKIKVSADTTSWVFDLNTWVVSSKGYALGMMGGQIKQKPAKIEIKTGIGAFNYDHLYAPVYVSDKGSRVDVDDPPQPTSETVKEINNLIKNGQLYDQLVSGGGKEVEKVVSLNPIVTFPPGIFASSYDDFRNIIKSTGDKQLIDKVDNAWLEMTIGSSLMGASAVIFIAALIVFVINNNKMLHMKPESRKGGNV